MEEDSISMEEMKCRKLKTFITIPSPLLTLTTLGKRAHLLVYVLFTFSPFCFVLFFIKDR